MPKLIIYDEKIRGIDLPDSPVILGRSRKSDIPIRDAILSRKHCAILPRTQDSFRLIDLKSSHGTYLNGKRISRAKLTFEDIVEVGSTVLVFCESDQLESKPDLGDLKNPEKVKTLVKRLGGDDSDTERINVERFKAKKPTGKRRRDLIESLPDLKESSLTEGGRLAIEDELLELLVDYSLHKATSLLIQNRTHLKKVIAKTVEESLVEMLSGNWDTIRSSLKSKLKSHLQLPEDEPDSEEREVTQEGEDSP